MNWKSRTQLLVGEEGVCAVAVGEHGAAELLDGFVLAACAVAFDAVFNLVGHAGVADVHFSRNDGTHFGCA